MKPEFLAGVLSSGYLIAALFFLRYWRDSRDRLFLMFALAFALLSGQRLLLVLADGHPLADYAYLVRLGAFVLILAAIIDKNRGAPRRAGVE